MSRVRVVANLSLTTMAMKMISITTFTTSPIEAAFAYTSSHRYHSSSSRNFHRHYQPAYTVHLDSDTSSSTTMSATSTSRKSSYSYSSHRSRNTFIGTSVAATSIKLFPSLKWGSTQLHNSIHSNDDDLIDDDLEEEEDLMPPPINPMLEDDELISPTRRSEVEKLTVPQLRQQLRLRGKKVSGKKSELIDRLLMMDINFDLEEEQGDEDGFVADTVVGSDSVGTATNSKTKSKAREFAESRGKEFIDVTAYLDEEDIGKETRSTKRNKVEDDSDSNIGESSSPETWGNEARIVEDYDGRSIVVDNLSRTVVEFKGSNQTNVQAYVVASRDSLKPFLAGGNRTMKNSSSNSTDAGSDDLTINKYDPEEEVRKIQIAREKASRVPTRFEDIEGVDEDDEEGHYTNIVEREFSDWGKYTLTGAQLSAQEIQGVLLLPDVYGAFSDDIQTLANKIAFECQPVVVFVPDLFRGTPWKESSSGSGVDDKGHTYEEWRSINAPDQRVSVDIRAAAAALREQYGVSSVSLFGTCFGGGRALEATARVYPDNNMDDVTGNPGPPHVNPAACIAWYPTRYDAKKLFGPGIGNERTVEVDDEFETAIMAIFAGDDEIPGARKEDAAELKSLLELDSRIKDHMVKVFPDQKHGFAHIGIANKQSEEDEDKFLKEEFGGVPYSNFDSGDAEVACLLSTAWMETYSRVFLPTMGPAVTDDENWAELEMKDLSSASKRNVREELEEALNTHQDAELDLRRMHPDDFNTPIDDMEDIDPAFSEALKTKPYGITLDDDPETMLLKLEEAIERGDLGGLPGFGEIPLDDTEDAYW